MTEFEATLDSQADQAVSRQEIQERVWDLLRNLLRRFILFVSFGPGVLGFLWLVGKIFKR